jgi:hypothetical protein
MNKFMAILELAAIIAVLSPMTGQAQVSALHRSHFKIDKLSTRKAGAYTYVDGEITSNAKKEAGSVRIRVRWFDKNAKVVDTSTTNVLNLAPGETLPFAISTRHREMVRYEVTVDYASER